MTNRQPTSRTGWWRLLLAALAAALIGLLGAGTASAATAPAAETRVGASTPATSNVVGVHESVSAGQRWGHAPPQAETVVATGVAAKTESRVLSKVDDLPCNCFVAGTTVQTSKGAKPIEGVRPGDQVWAKNLTTGKNELRPVTGLFQKKSTTLMTITLASGATVVVTQEHPFMVDGEGWVLSGDLLVGDRLTQRGAGTAVIAAINVRSGGQTVYNFEVSGDHNYYITDAQLLVHNCSTGDPHNILNAAARGVDVDHVWANGDLYTQVRGEQTRLVRVLSRGGGQNDVVIRELDDTPVTSMVISDESLAGRIADGRWQ